MTEASREATVRALLTQALGDSGEPPADLPFSVAGGHSLAAARLIAALRAELGVELSLVSVLREDPTIGQLVAMVAAAEGGPAVPAPPTGTSDADQRPTRARLSQAMEPVWAFHRLHPQSPAYNVVRVLTVPGRLRPAALRAAAADLSGRHDVLRSCVLEARPGQPEFVARPRITPALTAEVVRTPAPDQPLDWRVAAPTAVEAALRAAADRPFDMTDSSLWRLHVVYAPSLDRSWLLLVTHHLISDLRASDLLLHELAAWYGYRLGGSDGLPPALPPAPSIMTHLRAEADYLASPERRQRSEADLAWWSETLSGNPTTRSVPLSVPPASDEEFRSDQVTVSMDAAPVERLARELRVTSATVLLTAVMMVLATWRGTGDMDIVGIPSAQIRRPEDQDLIGFLVDTIPVQCPLARDVTFASACAAVRASYLDSLEHATGTLGEIMAHLGIPRESVRSSLVSLWFNDLTHANAPARLGDAECAELDLVPGWALFDLGLYVRRTGPTLRLHGVVTHGIFGPGTLESLIAQIARVVERALADPGQPLTDLVAPDVTPAPEQELRTGTPIAAAIRRHAAEHPDRTAIEQDGVTVSYQELAGQITQRAAAWNAECSIALGATRSAQYVVNLLAAVEAGASVVLIDQNWPAERQLTAIDEAEVTETLGIKPEVAGASRLVPRAPGRGGLAIQFTSGSTGTPLGVATPHEVRQACVTDLGTWAGITSTDRVAFLSGPSHDPAWRDIGLPLLAGGSLHIPPEEVQQDPSRVFDWLVAARITVASATAPLLALAVAGMTSPATALRLIISGGAPLSAALAQELQAAAPGVTVVNGYGCTETPQLLTALRLPPSEPIAYSGDLPIGPPFPGRRVMVRSEDGRPCDVGQLGSIWASAPHIASGYLGSHPDGDGVTATRFLTGDDGARWFATGDLARLDAAGVFWLAGRADRQRLINGYRVVLDDIEAVARTADVVATAAARVVGSGAQASVRLVVQPVPGTGAVQEDIREQVREKLLSQLPTAAVPTSITVTEEMAVTGNLKVAAAQLPVAPTPAPTVPEAPLPEVARDIAALAASILDSPVQLTDNFFEAGFTSLTLLHFTTELSTMLNREIPPITLFRYSSLQRLFKYLGITEAAPRQRAPAAGDRPARDSVRSRRRQLRNSIRTSLGAPAA